MGEKRTHDSISKSYIWAGKNAIIIYLNVIWPKITPDYSTLMKMVKVLEKHITIHPFL